MVRSWSIVLGIGLVIMWLAGLSSPNSASWLTWLDGVGAICAFLIAAGTDVSGGRRMGTRAGGPIAMAVGLFVLWIVGLSTAVAPSWQSWWNFAFACAFLLVGIGGASIARRNLHTATHTSEEEERRYRRSA